MPTVGVGEDMPLTLPPDEDFGVRNPLNDSEAVLLSVLRTDDSPPILKSTPVAPVSNPAPGVPRLNTTLLSATWSG